MQYHLRIEKRITPKIQTRIDTAHDFLTTHKRAFRKETLRSGQQWPWHESVVIDVAADGNSHPTSHLECVRLCQPGSPRLHRQAQPNANNINDGDYRRFG
ncbi:hypothetical protein GCM10010521_43830 [Streptomyces rameus]|uniref:Transposase n=1 Tax=Streptomyces rameus TaxID=68261 RepID=A0ABP6NKR5_9ACTN